MSGLGENGEEDVDRDELDAARAEVRRVLGGQLAAKASDRFAVAVARRGRAGPSAGLEAVGGPATPIATVVEFTGDAEPPALRDATAVPGWPELARAVEAYRSALPPSTSLRAPKFVRQALVDDARREGYRVVSPVYDEIERLAGGTLGPEREVLGDTHIPTLVTQVCWLNRTVRTFGGPEILADVAADPAVTVIDVPRRLMPESNHTDPPNLAAIGVQAFRRATGATGEGIIAAVTDSEVARSHPALRDRVVHRRNYTPEPWGNPGAHGTAVAGIIAGDDERFGGLAPRAVVYNYKLLATNRFLNSDDFGGALAIQQALEDGADVCNCSWGAGPAGQGTSREARAVDRAWDLGLVVVKSAGNRGPGASTMTTPADARGVIVVGATDVDGGEVQGYSSRGPAGARAGPDLVAPGGAPTAFINCCLVSGGFGDAGFGTSYAAPHVTGLVALLLQLDPDLLPDQVRERLLKAATQLPMPTTPDAQGVGLLHAS